MEFELDRFTLGTCISGIVGLMVLASWFMLIPTMIMVVALLLTRNREASALELKILRFALFSSITSVVGGLALQIYYQISGDAYYKSLTWPDAAIFLASIVGGPVQLLLLRILKEKEDPLENRKWP